MLPSDLENLIDQIDACERGAAALVSDLDQAAANWSPSPGSVWSVAQCLNHLTLMNEFYLRGGRAALDRARENGVGPFRGLRPTLIGRSFVRWMEPPARLKVKAQAVVTPASEFSVAELMPAYARSHDEFRFLVRASADLDVNRVILPNPFLRHVRMQLSTMLLLIPAHDRRHLHQARQARQARQVR
ncbi:MAG: DinB family protein [Acidobacteriota bacterium]